MTQWNERRILVVGGRTGMGEATSARLVELGADVVRADLPLPGWGDSADQIEIDVRDEASVTRAIAQATAVLGGLDVVVMCAGILGPVSPLVDLSIDDFDRVVSVNLRGAFLVAKSTVPELLKQPNSRLVFVASIAGKEGNPGMSAYSASKAGVIGLVKALAKEHAGNGLTVNAIAPASIETPLLAGMTTERREVQLSLMPMGRFGKPSEVASLIEYIASDEAGFTTGFVYDLSGGRATY
ncbi:SDR family NAD(P)-dependent oxidoreductase [Pseudarthrobacter sp. CC12]|uniref:SDR family NAD(P)-dependent oxidoreductase n=1 Tax=Pseudarthrobacter sp. CC12 TaxID=3029193 RepID=UPI0032654BE4